MKKNIFDNDKAYLILIRFPNVDVVQQDVKERHDAVSKIYLVLEGFSFHQTYNI